MIDDDPFDDVHILEALQTTYVLADTFHQHVSDSRCAGKYPEVAEAAQRAEAAIWAVYQIIGGIDEIDEDDLGEEPTPTAEGSIHQ